MKHRHINTDVWSLMAIESLFDRGTLADWREFATALRSDRTLPDRVRRVCGYRQPDGAERIAMAIVDPMPALQEKEPDGSHEPSDELNL